MKKYRVLKDLPSIPEGSVGTYSDELNMFTCAVHLKSGDVIGFCNYNPVFFPDFFQPVEEELTKEQKAVHSLSVARDLWGRTDVTHKRSDLMIKQLIDCLGYLLGERK
jgi:hypothetical protein